MQNGNFLLRCRRRLVANLDGPLLLIVVLIMACGLATVYSATYDVSNRAYNQLFNMSVGFVVMWVFAQIPPQKLMRFAVPLYVVGIILLEEEQLGDDQVGHGVLDGVTDKNNAVLQKS